jgi:hypothetical protein
MSRGGAGKNWEALKTNGIFATQRNMKSLRTRSNSLSNLLFCPDNFWLGAGGYEPPHGGIKIRCQHAKCLRWRSHECEARHAALEPSHSARGSLRCGSDVLSIRRIRMTPLIARRRSSRFGELPARQNRLKNRFSRCFSNGETG